MLRSIWFEFEFLLIRVEIVSKTERRFTYKRHSDTQVSKYTINKESEVRYKCKNWMKKWVVLIYIYIYIYIYYGLSC